MQLDNKQIALANTNLDGGAPSIQEIGDSIPGVATTISSIPLPATLTVPEISTAFAEHTAEVSPTLAANGRLTDLPGKASITAEATGKHSGATSTEPGGGWMVLGLASLLAVVAGSSFALCLGIL